MTGGARTNTLNFAVDVLTRVIDAERRPQPGSSQSERLAAVECRWGVRHVEGVDLSVSEESSSGVRFRLTSAVNLMVELARKLNAQGQEIS